MFNRSKLHRGALIWLFCVSSGCGPATPQDENSFLERYRPFGVSRICVDGPVKIGLIESVGDYSIWRIAAGNVWSDSYVLSEKDSNCDLRFDYAKNLSIENPSVDQLPTLTQYINYSPESSLDTAYGEWQFSESLRLQQAVLEDRFSICDQRTGNGSSDECKTEVYQWLLKEVVTLSFSFRAGDNLYYPRIEVIDGEPFWMGEKLL